MNCPSQKENLKNCSCTYQSCSRRGKCCQCISYHREKGGLPGCLFSEEAEKSYDRSLKNFLADKG